MSDQKFLEKPALRIHWANPCAARRYCAQALSGRDAARAQHPRSARARLDWQVSRALLQSLGADPAGAARSLSHSHGHAVCLSAPSGWRAGIDLERTKPRDVMRLAEWVCSPAEQRWLEQGSHAERLQRFYLLWTLKEAFTKAAGLSFPAALPTVGVAACAPAGFVLQAPPGVWQACSWQVEPDWVLSYVWHRVGRKAAPMPEDTAAAPDLVIWRAMPECALPARRLLGQWQSCARPRESG